LNEEHDQVSEKENQFKAFEENCLNYDNLYEEYQSVKNELSKLEKEVSKFGTSKSIEELQKDQQLYQNKR